MIRFVLYMTKLNKIKITFQSEFSGNVLSMVKNYPCDGLASHPERRNNTPSCFMLKKSREGSAVWAT